MITPAECQRLASWLELVSNAHRVHILLILAEGERTVDELQAMVCASRPQFAQQLAFLRVGGLVEFSQDGRWHIYSLTAAGRVMLQAVEAALRAG
jgi:predicted transcriptional regulator